MGRFSGGVIQAMSTMATQTNCRDMRTLKRAKLLIWMALFIVFGNAENLASEKHIIKSIKTEFGDILDCFDIYKQPAFDHPLLKNHTLQMRPTSFPIETTEDEEDPSDSEVELSDCPEGTVPILRNNQTQDFFRKPSRNATIDDLRAFHHYAVIKSPQGAYLGTRARMNVWPLKLAHDYMFSVGQFWIQGGPDEHVNTIEAGWTVSPQSYGNQATRLFAYWTGDNYNNGCLNARCPGYVHVSKKIAMGAAIKPLSTYNGQQKDITLGAFKDPKTSNWWLTFGRNNNEALGYWPKELFSYLGTGPANWVSWGGEVYNPTVLPHPPMGSGHFPGEGFGKASYMSLLKVVNTNNALVDAPDKADIIARNPQCFNVDSSSKKGGPNWGRYFYFGGPGGKWGPGGIC